MLETVEGVITRIVKYGESSLILDLLCPDDGIRSYIVGGIRKKGKRDKSALVRPVNLVKAEVYSKDGGKLSRVKEISYNYIYKDIPFDVAKSTIALFLVEVCRKAVKASDDAKGIYNYIVKGLIHLDNLRKGRKRVIQSLVDYYSYHIDGFGELKSLDVLMSLYR